MIVSGVRNRSNFLRMGLPRILLFLVLVLLACSTIYPVYFTLISSLKNQAAWSASKFSLPIPPYFEHYANAWRRANVFRTLINSIIVTTGGVALCSSVCILASFAVTKLRFRGSKLIFIFLISSLMVPMQTILYPYFKVMSDLRLTDKYFGLILSFATFQIPIMTYQYAAYLKKIPSSLIEAGRIDGASIMQVITYIMIPVSQPVMVTAGLVSFAWMWNEILLPIMILQTPRMQTLIVSLSSLKGQYGTSPTLVCAGAFIGILPVSLMYVFFQRHLLQGMTAGALKG